MVNGWELKSESVLWAGDAFGLAHFPDNREPCCGEHAPHHGVVHCCQTQTEGDGNPFLPKLGCNVFCMIHHCYFPQMVDEHNTTIGRLQNNSQWVD
jgi:hypothetical protein